MADFCYQDTREVFGDEYGCRNDMAGICGPSQMVTVLCEHCGLTRVDEDGVCIGPCDNPEHQDLYWRGGI